MNRETVKVSDLAKNTEYPDIDDWESIRLIDRKQVKFDSEKGSVKFECIIQRLSDHKFFKFEYTKFGYSGDDIRDQIAKEVFPKTKTITYYE